MKEIEYWIKNLNLSSLWTSDYLAHGYISDSWISFNGAERAILSSAYYLLPETSISPFHKLDADEVWQHCEGGALNLFLLDLNGKAIQVSIGKNIEEGDVFYYVVPAGTWMAAKPKTGSKYVLLSHFLSPEFSLNNEVYGTSDVLRAIFPNISEELLKMAWPENHPLLNQPGSS